MNNPKLAMAVINHITSKTISADANCQLASQSLVHSSGFLALAGNAGDQKGFEVKTITTTGNQTFGGVSAVGPLVTNGSWEYTLPNQTLPNDNTYYPGIPYIGDPIPFAPGGFPTNPPPFVPLPVVFPAQTGILKIIPDLELLEEGVHDIKGGKVIIKKILITEEQIEEALEEKIGHKPTDEEKQKLHEDLEQIAASEEREV